ncbi:Neuropeptide Y receptor [Cichlidogyrus casuarinus]|uniref:Neuropeptide Y receptor n=1 Tax=Cichlidogyrus casuarinus TaxID=1844966 RepID=A0ABD2QAT0_9PLAT
MGQKVADSMNNHEILKCQKQHGQDFTKLLECIGGVDYSLQTLNTLPDFVLYPLLIAYSSMIVFGACGSLLVIYAILQSSKMRNARNFYIMNLAVSDLILCTFSQPFTLLRALSQQYPWMLGVVICKLVAFGQAANIFISTLSITAIALDRFQLVLNPTSGLATKKYGTLFAIIIIWIFGLGLSIPPLFFTTTMTNNSNRTICTEVIDRKSNIFHLKRVYSIVSLIVQYAVPLLVIMGAYMGICIRLKYRNQSREQHASVMRRNMIQSQQQNNLLQLQSNGPEPSINNGIKRENSDRRKLVNGSSELGVVIDREKLNLKRQRRTNLLLACVALTFAISWLPLTVNNLVLDFWGEAKEGTKMPTSARRKGLFNESQKITITQCLCLLCVLFSSCANPVLYGWLNNNFREEFKSIFLSISRRCCKKHNKEDQITKSRMGLLSSYLRRRKGPDTQQVPVTVLVCSASSAKVAPLTLFPVDSNDVLMIDNSESIKNG